MHSSAWLMLLEKIMSILEDYKAPEMTMYVSLS